jgi:heme/copper-type cytochrome/quinol oxidase subunit 3
MALDTATAPATAAEIHGPAARPAHGHSTVTPGKVAMWFFLATEVMFFTGLIGTYIVLRAGSPPAAYSNLFPPASPAATQAAQAGLSGLHVTQAGDVEAVARILRPLYEANGAYYEGHDLEHLIEAGHAVTPGLEPEKLEALAAKLRAAGATVEEEALKIDAWPLPYDHHTNPLSIDLTAANTFILICSSVTMVLALAAIQRGDAGRMRLWLLATIVIGSVFLGVQVYEYHALMFGHVYPPGISADGHFRPSSSLFSSCFFTMTGFHGAHVAGGIITLILLFLSTLKRGRYTRENHSAIELVGLYWHFVDLVWIILFTVVYLI